MTGQTIAGDVSRRALLTGGLASGFLLAFHVPVRAVNEPEQPPDDTAGKFAPNAFIRIDHSGRTTLVMPQVEMGQGTYTSISMILAEELDADFAKVVVAHARWARLPARAPGRLQQQNRVRRQRHGCLCARSNRRQNALGVPHARQRRRPAHRG